jgi:type IV pilus assembly protein PilQ
MTRNFKPIGEAPKWVRLLVLCAGMLAMPLAVQAQQPSRTLQGIEVEQLPGQQVQLRLRMDGMAPQPMAFTIDNPARISLDLPDTALSLDQRRTDVGVGVLNSVVAAEAGGKTRVVLNLSSLVAYETIVDGDSILVRIGTGSAEADRGYWSQSAMSDAPPPVAGGRSISNIDFRRSEDGAGQVQVTLTDPNTVVDFRQVGEQIVVDFRGASLPEELVRRLDVTDFATPVVTVDALRAGDNARLVINANGAFEQLAYQSDEVFSIEIREAVVVTDAPSAYGEGRNYMGERLTLNFQDIEVRAVLQLLADMSDMNIVVSDTVQGNVTLRLQNVPWDQALDIVLQTKGLDMRQRDNVIIVAPAAEIATRERQALEARREIEELVPLRSEFIQVNYAKAAALATLVEGGEGGALMSERGSVAIDERTNTLLIQDTADRIDDIRRLVKTLDIPVKQVLIESRIVVVNDDFSRELGVQLGYTGVEESGGRLYTTSGTSAGTDTMVSGYLDSFTDNDPTNDGTVTIPTGDSRFERYNVNLPVVNRAGSIALAVLDDDYLVDLELSAAQSEDRAEIISTPRVITANQQEARIKAGVEIPYQEASSSGATTTQFKEAVLSLQVTPQITPDEKVIMDLIVNKDNVGEFVPSATGGLVPSIDTREITTKVLVNDGETVVLGGIFETERRDTEFKTPFLGDIPVVGNLFKTTQRSSDKSELLIFITPKILRDGASLY